MIQCILPGQPKITSIFTAMVLDYKGTQLQLPSLEVRDVIMVLARHFTPSEESDQLAHPPHQDALDP